MLVDGIYSVHFETPVGQGDGIVVVTGEKLRGGDASFVYYGLLEQTSNGFSIQI